MNQSIPITIRRSKDPNMIELWSANSLWAVVHEDLFYGQLNLKEIIGNESQGSEANFDLVLKED